MGFMDRTIKVAKDVPRILHELMSGSVVEIVPDKVSLKWSQPVRHVTLIDDQIKFKPPLTVYASWLGITVNTELHYAEIQDQGTRVILSITGPDITLTLEVDDDDAGGRGATPGIGGPTGLDSGAGETETS